MEHGLVTTGERNSCVGCDGGRYACPRPVLYPARTILAPLRHVHASETRLATSLPCLISMLNDPKGSCSGLSPSSILDLPSITSCAITNMLSPEHNMRFFAQTPEGASEINVEVRIVLTPASQLLRMVLDNKRVQEVGCSAFVSLEEDARPKLVPCLPLSQALSSV